MIFYKREIELKFLLLGKGLSNDGVAMLLKEDGIEYDYKDITEVENYEYDYVVKAPGIPYHNEVIKRFLEKKIIMKLFSKNLNILKCLEIHCMVISQYYIK